MKLIDACEDALFLGLTYISEALNNAYMHMENYFPYDKIDDEVKELREDASKYPYDARILNVFPELLEKNKENNEKFLQYCEGRR